MLISSLRFRGLFVVQTPGNPIRKIVNTPSEEKLKDVDFRIFPSATRKDQFVIATKKKTEDHVFAEFKKLGFDRLQKVKAGNEEKILESHFPTKSSLKAEEIQENKYRQKHLRELHKLGWIYGPRNRRKMDEVFELKGCTVKLDRKNDYLETVFPDGTSVPAVPHKRLDYYKTADKLGYGVDIGALSREHELFHTLVSEAEGHPHSPTLYAVAHKFGPGSPKKIVLLQEEDRVMDFQALVNGIEGAGQKIAEEVRALRQKAIDMIRKPK
jgi:hypothetical protein